jgi:hypothetical protein
MAGESGLQNSGVGIIWSKWAAGLCIEAAATADADQNAHKKRLPIRSVSHRPHTTASFPATPRASLKLGQQP